VLEGVDAPKLEPGVGCNSGGGLLAGKTGGANVAATLEQSAPAKPSAQTQVFLLEQIYMGMYHLKREHIRQRCTYASSRALHILRSRGTPRVRFQRTEVDARLVQANLRQNRCESSIKRMFPPSHHIFAALRAVRHHAGVLPAGLRAEHGRRHFALHLLSVDRLSVTGVGALRDHGLGDAILAVKSAAFDVSEGRKRLIMEMKLLSSHSLSQALNCSPYLAFPQLPLTVPPTLNCRKHAGSALRDLRPQMPWHCSSMTGHTPLKQ